MNRITFQNYVERSDAFYNTQMACLIIMSIVILAEARHFVSAVVLLDTINPNLILWKKALVYIISAFAYIGIPLLVLMTSILVILESGSELDVMKDAMALVFMLEINNFLQIATTDDSKRWTISATKAQALRLERAKSRFTALASIVHVVLGFVVYLVFGDVDWAVENVKHPSRLFNPMKYPAGWLVFFTFFAIYLACLTFGIAYSNTSFSWFDGTKHRSMLHQDGEEQEAEQEPEIPSSTTVNDSATNPAGIAADLVTPTAGNMEKHCQESSPAPMAKV